MNMINMTKFFSIIIFVLLISFNSIAEIFNCKGVISNIPCDQLNQKKSEVAKSEDESETKSELTVKKSLIHNLSLKKGEARRKHQIFIDSTYEEDTCLKVETSIQQCSELLKKIESGLDTKVDKAKQLELEEKKIQLLKEQNEIQKKRAEEGSKVVIINPPIIGNQLGNNQLLPRNETSFTDQNGNSISISSPGAVPHAGNSGIYSETNSSSTSVSINGGSSATVNSNSNSSGVSIPLNPPTSNVIINNNVTPPPPQKPKYPTPIWPTN